jgi:hypothetical protein
LQLHNAAGTEDTVSGCRGGAGAGKSVAAEPKASGTETKPGDVITKVTPPKKPPELVVAEEASKGYDIMVVGVECKRSGVAATSMPTSPASPDNLTDRLQSSMAATVISKIRRTAS